MRVWHPVGGLLLGLSYRALQVWTSKPPQSGPTPNAQVHVTAVLAATNPMLLNGGSTAAVAHATEVVAASGDPRLRRLVGEHSSIGGVEGCFDATAVHIAKSILTRCSEGLSELTRRSHLYDILYRYNTCFKLGLGTRSLFRAMAWIFVCL